VTVGLLWVPPLRIKYEGVFYHVTFGGNERRKIFFGKADYEKFTSYLKKAKEEYGCLFENIAG
jgi:REP element-mobilizing transposase RayT